MIVDNTTFVTMRLIVLLVLAVVSQLALHKKQYSLALWTFSFWLTLFRLLAIRVLRLYPHQEDTNVFMILNLLMNGLPALITDIFLLISSVPMYIWITKTYQSWKKGVL